MKRKEIDGMVDGVLDTDRSYPIPARMKRHKAVQEVLDGPAEGFDYKWNVFLKEGWEFSRGRMEGCRTGNFNTLEDFLLAEPRLRQPVA